MKKTAACLFVVLGTALYRFIAVTINRMAEIYFGSSMIDEPLINIEIVKKYAYLSFRRVHWIRSMARVPCIGKAE